MLYSFSRDASLFLRFFCLIWAEISANLVEQVTDNVHQASGGNLDESMREFVSARRQKAQIHHYIQENVERITCSRKTLVRCEILSASAKGLTG